VVNRSGIVSTQCYRYTSIHVVDDIVRPVKYPLRRNVSSTTLQAGGSSHIYGPGVLAVPKGPSGVDYARALLIQRASGVVPRRVRRALRAESSCLLHPETWVEAAGVEITFPGGRVCGRTVDGRRVDLPQSVWWHYTMQSAALRYERQRLISGDTVSHPATVMLHRVQARLERLADEIGDDSQADPIPHTTIGDVEASTPIDQGVPDSVDVRGPPSTQRDPERCTQGAPGTRCVPMRLLGPCARSNAGDVEPGIGTADRSAVPRSLRRGGPEGRGQRHRAAAGRSKGHP